VSGPLRYAWAKIPLKRAPDKPDALNFPIQVIRFGSELTLVALAGEVVVDYSLRLKREPVGPGATWVVGYANASFGYIPSNRIFQEGGYEAAGWKLPIEESIVGKVRELQSATK